jgi:hypothetical protein
MNKLIATAFLGIHFIKTVFCRLFKIRRRGLAEFRKDYDL